MTIYTIGHSTRSSEELAHLLLTHGVAQVVDIRSIPRSRRHPHFHADVLEAFLVDRGIRYRHMPELGGLRRPRPDSPNRVWREAGFRGYADYMMTEPFERGLARLVDHAIMASTALMCAEALWWRCHRRLIADALVARGESVRHIMSAGESSTHEVTAFARVRDGRVDYAGV